jgi:hypothetical protein
MRTAWIFELAPSSSAALLRARLARLEHTIGLCATIVLCTIGHANSIYRHLRRIAIHISHQIWCSAAVFLGVW